MILKVNDEYQIANDDCYYTVQKRREIKESKKNPELNGTYKWENQTYHVRLEDAYASMLDKSITICDDFVQVIKLLKDVKEQIKNNVKG
jgi:hypothetical protein